MSDGEYPEHEKLGEVSTRSHAIGEFMEWLQSEKNVVLAYWPEGREELAVFRAQPNELLAEFFDINLTKLEEEKRDMLDKLRKALSPDYAVGTKVIAISHADDEKVYVFGRGEYIGHKNPDEDAGIPKPSGAFMGTDNPCIKLDNGQYVWGCECWWGPEDVLNQKFGGREEVAIDIDKRREEVRAQRKQDDD